MIAIRFDRGSLTQPGLSISSTITFRHSGLVLRSRSSTLGVHLTKPLLLPTMHLNLRILSVLSLIVSLVWSAPIRTSQPFTRQLIDLPDVSLLKDNEVLSDNGNGNTIGDDASGR